MRNAAFVVFAFCVLLPTAPFAPPQIPPCRDVEAVPGVMGYQHRSESVHCEGLYQSPVAGESLELLSFANGDIKYDLAIDKVLVIAAPDVSRLGASKVNVRARALPLNTYYRMDTSVPSAKAIEWPLGVVIKPADLNADSIGVVGWIETEGAKTWVPLSVFPKGKSPVTFGSVLVVFRSSVDIQKLQWRQWVEGGTDLPPSWQVLGGDTPAMIRGGDPIKFSVSRSSQVQNLDIAAKLVNSDDWLKLLLRVYVQ